MSYTLYNVIDYEMCSETLDKSHIIYINTFTFNKSY